MNDKEWMLLEMSGPGPIGAKLKRLPTSAAIYSFCQNIAISSELQYGSERLLQYLRELCETPHGPNVSTELGAYESVLLVHESKVPFSYLKNKREILSILDDKSFVHCLSNILSAAQGLVPPYYVGETRNLQERVGQHLGADSDLRTRLHAKDIRIESLVLRYYLLDKDCESFLGEGVGVKEVSELEESEVDEEVVLNAMIASGLRSTSYNEERQVEQRKRKFVEELLSRVCRPRYIEQLGSRQIIIDD